MKQEIHRLNKLVNDFLMYSKPMKLSRQQVSATALLEDVVASSGRKRKRTASPSSRNMRTTGYTGGPDLFKSCC